MRPERRKGIGAPWYVPPMAPATLTPPRERARRGTGSGLGRPWRVIVLNDDHNTFQGVAYALSNVLPGRELRQGDDAREPHPRHGSGDRLVGREGDGGAVLDAASGLRSDDGAARAVAESRAGHRGSVLAVLLALTGYETALLVVAALLHRRSRSSSRSSSRVRGPSFPGNRLGLFLAICGVFFVAQMTAVLVLAEVGEADEPVHEEPRPRRARRDADRRPRRPSRPSRREAAGDPVAGKEVFLGTAGCASCHTLADAGATGTVGPNLDAVKPSLRQGRRRR